MSPDLFRPQGPSRLGGSPQGHPIGWAKKECFIQGSPDRNNPFRCQWFRARSVHTCGLSRCLETSFRSSTTIG